MTSFKGYGNGDYRRKASALPWLDWMEIPILDWLATQPLSMGNRRCVISFRAGSNAFGTRFNLDGSLIMPPLSRAFGQRLRSGKPRDVARRRPTARSPARIAAP